MLRRSSIRALISAIVLALPVAIATTAPAQAAAPSTDRVTVLQTTLYYDDSSAAEFKADVAKGMEVWNTSVQNVRILKAAAGQRANIRVIADNGWPRAYLGPVRPGGQVIWYFGRQAVNQGYNKVRIAAHETGHSLGLPDIKPGPCSSLMSGSTAGVSCANPYPNATEKARVERNYGGFTSQPGSGKLLVDATAH